MTYYGFDMKSGIWDTKLFPITKKDKEIEGINTDRLRFNDAVKNIMISDSSVKEISAS
jgi:hypothetical protein